MADDAIGMFDSGMGGLTVWREVVRLLPHENVVYFADQRHCPYGEKSQADLQARATVITQWLLDNGCSLIVIACNAATVSSISSLRRQFPQVSFVGVEPAVKPAAARSKSGQIAILTTSKTKKSARQRGLIKSHAQSVKVHILTAPEFVEIVEEGDVSSTSTKKRVKEILMEKKLNNVDILILGCTHYPFLADALREALPGMSLINPTRAVAKQVKKMWEGKVHKKRGKKGNHEFYTNQDPDKFHRIAEKLLGDGLPKAKRITI